MLMAQPQPPTTPSYQSTTQVRSSDNVEEGQATESLVTNLVSLSSGEERERKVFMSDLNKFMTEIGKPLSKIPIMGYKELDLFQLFKEVTAYGGFNEVVKNVGTWSKIWKRLGNFDPSITDSSFRLKKNYERYLLEYEYKSFPEHRQQALEFERQMQLKKSSQLQHQHQQSQQASAPSSSSNNNTPLSEPSSPTIAMAHLSLNGTTNPFQPSPLKTSSDKIKSGSKKTSGGAASARSPTSSSRPALTRSYSAGSIRGNNAAIYKEIIRDKDGTPKLPLALGDLTLESLGAIVPRVPFVTDRHIWPVGFVSSRYFSSMINPELKVKYTSQIVESSQGKPQFIITAEDDVDHPVVAHSPSAAWRAVLKRVAPQTSGRENISVSGTMRFGLAHPVVSHLIRELPGASGLTLSSTNHHHAQGGIDMSGASSNAGGSSSAAESYGSTWNATSASSSSSSLASSRPKRKAVRRTIFTSNSSDDSSSAEDSFDISSNSSGSSYPSSSDSSPYNPIEFMEDNVDERMTSPKLQKHSRNEDHFSARTVTFTTREEMDDLESAVATLQALKYCAVF